MGDSTFTVESAARARAVSQREEALRNSIRMAFEYPRITKEKK